MLAQTAKTTFIFQILITLIAVVAAMSFVLQLEISAFLSVVVVFLLPPITLGLWLFRKRKKIVYSGDNRRNILAFRVVFVAGWCAVLLPVVFRRAMFFYILEPWPFSLRQGPDTVYSQERFRKVLGFVPENEVNSIFYKGYDIRDYDRYSRFRSCDKSIAEKVLLNLEKQPAEEVISRQN
jgi:hypothetical protein